MSNTTPSEKIHIYDSINTDIIEDIKDMQSKAKIKNMSLPKD